MVVVLKKKLKQEGFILVIALILMLVMVFAAVAAIRLSGLDNQANSNTRSKLQAIQAAETAISYCKTEVFSGTPGINVIADLEDEGFEWKKAEVWADAGKINKLAQEDAFHSLQTDQIQTSIYLPECVIEDVSTFTQENSDKGQKVAAYKITARGYSPNYTADSSGVQVSGAQVWLQVVVARLVS